MFCFLFKAYFSQNNSLHSSPRSSISTSEGQSCSHRLRHIHHSDLQHWVSLDLTWLLRCLHCLLNRSLNVAYMCLFKSWLLCQGCIRSIFLLHDRREREFLKRQGFQDDGGYWQMQLSLLCCQNAIIIRVGVVQRECCRLASPRLY